MKRPLAAATIILAAWADAALGLGAAAQTISGEIRGELVSLGPARIVLRASDGKERSARLDSVIAVGFSNAGRDVPSVPNARLEGGGLIRGRVSSAGDDDVTMTSAAFGEVKVPVSQISGLTLPGAKRELWDEVERRITSPPGIKDVLLLPNGDRMEGLAARISADTVTFSGELGELDYTLSKLAGLAFGSASRRPAEAKGLRVRLIATTGERLLGVPSSLSGDRLSFKTTFGSRVTIAAADMLRIEVVGGRAVPLAGLDPVRSDSRTLYEGEPRVFPALSRGPGGVTLRPRSTVVYDLGGEFAEFTATARVAGPQGSVSLRILADGREAFSAEAIRGSDGPKPIRIKIPGAKRLAVTCGFGPDLDDAGDALVLERAHLVRPEPGGD